MGRAEPQQGASKEDTLPCSDLKGYNKGAGIQPGVRWLYRERHPMGSVTLGGGVKGLQ